MRRITFLFCVFLIAALAVAAAPIVNVTFVGSPNGRNAPYTLNVAGVTGTWDCYSDLVNVAGSWQAYLVPVLDTSVTVDPFYGNPNAETIYKELAWLNSKFATTPTSSYGDLQAAIWSYLNPNEPMTSGSNAWINAAKAQATSGFVGFDFSTYNKLVPVRVGSSQPFINDPAVPEPATYVMVGGALVALAFRRKRTRA